MAAASPRSRPRGNRSECWCLLPMSKACTRRGMEGWREGTLKASRDSVRQHLSDCWPLPDDRLVSVLRHRSFLKELQELALRGESPLLVSGEEGASHCPSPHQVRTETSRMEARTRPTCPRPRPRQPAVSPVSSTSMEMLLLPTSPKDINACGVWHKEHEKMMLLRCNKSRTSVIQTP